MNNIPDCMYDYRYDRSSDRKENCIYCNCCGVEISKTELIEYGGKCERCGLR